MAAGAPPRSTPPPILLPRWTPAVAVPAAAVVAYLAAITIGQALLVFGVAGVVALVLNPIVRGLERMRVPRTVAVIVVVLALLGATLGAVVAVGAAAVGQVRAFERDTPAYAERAGASAQRLQDFLARRGVTANFAPSVQRAVADSDQTLSRQAGRLAGYATDLARGVLTAIVGLILVVVIAAYLLIDQRRIVTAVARLFPPEHRPGVRGYFRSVQRAVSEFVKGQLLLMLVVGVAAGCGLWILGVTGVFAGGDEYAVALGVWAGLTEAVPLLGPFVGAAPAVALALLAGPTAALAVIVLFVVVQQAEGHLLVPNVMGRAVEAHPLLVIFALLCAQQIAGIGGMLLALPLLSIARETARFARARFALEPRDDRPAPAPPPPVRPLGDLPRPQPPSRPDHDAPTVGAAPVARTEIRPRRDG